MAVLGRKEQENAQLRDQLEQLMAQEAPTPEPDSQPGPQWQPGTRLVVGDDGQLTEYRPPQPNSPNETNYLGRGGDATKPKGDDGSAAYAREQMLTALGGKPEPRGWNG